MDSAQQIIQCYNCLTEGKDVDQATRLLIDFYKEEEAYPVLISILNSDQKEIIKKHATIGIHKILQCRYKITEKIDIEYFKPLFILIATLNSFPVVEFLVSIINSHTPDPELLEMIVGFCVQTANSNGDIGEPSYNYLMAIYSSLLLIDYNLPAGNIGISELSPIYEKLIGLGFESNNIDIQIASISCAFSFTSMCEDVLVFGPVSPQSVALLQNLIGDPHIYKLLSIFSRNPQNKSPLINIHMLIPELLAVVSHEKSNAEERKRAFDVIINILEVHKNEIFAQFSNKSEEAATGEQPNYVTPIFQTTVGLISTFFVLEDEYEMSPYDIVEKIAELFSDYPPLLQSFWEQISFLQEYPFGVFTILLFINFSLDRGYEFYEPKLNDIVGICCQVCSTTESPSLFKASIQTLGNIAITFTDNITNLTSPMQEAVFEALVKHPSVETLTLFSEFLENFDDVDEIIDKACEFLIQLLQHPEAGNDIKEQALWCMATLIKNSNQRVNELLGEFVPMLQSIIDSYDPSKEDCDTDIISAAIYSLGHLCSKCPEGFAPFAEAFADFLVNNVEQSTAMLQAACQSEEQAEAPIDDNIVIQCINAYSFIVMNLVEATNSTIEKMVQLLIQLCELPSHQTENEIFISGILDHISIQDISLRVLCGCLSKYPQILPDLLDKVFEWINVPMYHAAVGAKLIAETITALPNRAEAVPRLVDIALSNIEASTDPECTSTFFETLCTLIDWCGIEALKPEVFKTAEKAFKFNLLPCFTKAEQYDQKVHESAQRVFRYAIKTLHERAFQELHEYIDTFVELLRDDNKRMRDLSLHLLAELIQNTDGSGIPNELLQIVLEVSQEELLKENEFAYFAISNLAASSPFNFTNAEVFKSFIPILMQRVIFSQTEGYVESIQSQQATDVCVSALGSILMNVLGDSLFENFDIFDVAQNAAANAPLFMTFDDQHQPTGINITVPIITVLLRAMPAKIDVAENESIINFFVWLFEHSGGRSINEFGIILVKLFSVSPDELKEDYALEEVTITRLVPLLAQLIEACGGEQFCASVLDGNADRLEQLKSYLTQ